MKESELRIGNLVFEQNGLIGEVYNINIDMPEEYTKLNPIPLTEEWMVKLGGIKDEDGIFSYIQLCPIRDMRIYLAIAGCSGIIITKGMAAPLYKFEHIKSVHQLQNFYFAWKGEELKTQS